MGDVVLLSGQRIAEDLHLVPLSPRRGQDPSVVRYGVADTFLDMMVAEIHLARVSGELRAAGYRLTAPNCLVAVCPAHLAPRGPACLGQTLALLRRALADSPAPCECPGSGLR